MEDKEELQEISRDIRRYLEYQQELGLEGLGARDGLSQRSASQASKAQRPPTPKPSANITSPDIQQVAAAVEAEHQSASGSLTLSQVREKLGDCRRCKLCSTRTNLVFGSGNGEAKLVFVGEGPGRDEDIQGLPFVGRAGKLLTRMINAIDMDREQETYICNVIKCRPPGNRNPEPDEIAACEPFLLAQLQAIQPNIICTLGAHATHTLLKSKAPISSLRGRIHYYHDIKLIPTFHPAYLLRNPRDKHLAWEDLKLIRQEYLTHLEGRT